jgi:hypothetical protein
LSTFNVNTGTSRRKPRPPRRQATRDFYAQGNRAAADIILSDVERYGGEEALLVQWARLFLATEQADVANNRSDVRLESETLDSLAGGAW